MTSEPVTTGWTLHRVTSEVRPTAGVAAPSLVLYTHQENQPSSTYFPLKKTPVTFLHPEEANISNYFPSTFTGIPRNFLLETKFFTFAPSQKVPLKRNFDQLELRLSNCGGARQRPPRTSNAHLIYAHPVLSLAPLH